MWTDSDTGDQSKHGRAENIIDGVMRTRDERHTWTVPAPRGNPIALSVLLAGGSRLALLRIWVRETFSKSYYVVWLVWCGLKAVSLSWRPVVTVA